MWKLVLALLLAVSVSGCGQKAIARWERRCATMLRFSHSQRDSLFVLTLHPSCGDLLQPKRKA